VRGASPTGGSDRERRREVVAAFLAAARSGDFEALLAVLAPEVVVRADAAAARLGAAREVRGAAEAARGFAARSRGARAALVDGVDGAAWAPGGTPRVVFLFTVVDGKVAAVDLVADPDHLARLDVVMLEAI
jgi:RNA polymerase sigma-70 factor (ECF subfamily)